MVEIKIAFQYNRYDIEKMIHLTEEELSAIPGIGPVIAGAYVDYFADEKRVRELRTLLGELKIKAEEESGQAQIFTNKNFVITGSVEHFVNRNEVKELIESKGGKVTGSVTSKTDYLINNDVNSTSSKNKKAKELGISIITEEQFLEMLNE